MDEVDVQFYGDMAIVTGRVSASTRINDEVRNSAYRVSHVWVLEGEDWKRAGFHDGRIEPPNES